MADPKQKVISYKDKEITISTKGDTIEATVNSDSFSISCHKASGKYSSSKLPYKDYDDPESLIKDVIDHHPDFRG